MKFSFHLVAKRVSVRAKVVDATAENGFILPTVLLVSIAMMAIGLSLVQSTGSIGQSLESAYVNRLASEAANSGLVYANYCYAKNGGQTWNTAGGSPLTQSTDCNGTTQLNYQKTFLTYNNYSSTFRVNDITDGRTETSQGNVDTIFTLGVQKTVAASNNVVARQTIPSTGMKASFSAAGTAKTCGIVSGSIYCWGANSGTYAGQLGDGTTFDSGAYTPVKVLQEAGALAGKNPTAISPGEYHVCALASNTVYCWGQNQYGQFGNNSTTASPKPVQVKGLLDGKTVTAIGAADSTQCAIAEGKIYCWGDNSYGTTGTGSAANKLTTPTMLTTGLPAGYVATALARDDSESQTMCAIINSVPYCWGDNRAGGVGNPAYISQSMVKTPVPVDMSGDLNGHTVKAITVDGYNQYVSPTISSHACVIADNDQAYCWGDNDYGQLGMGNKTQVNSPKLVSAFAGTTVKGIATGVMHTCVLADTTVYCMGQNVYGQQGNNSTMLITNMNTSPTPIVDANNLLTGKTITSISGGANRTCVIADFSTYCWGFNSVGQIGDGTAGPGNNRNIPTLAKFLQPKATGFLF